MASKVRTTRIAERIREELSILLIREISDPRLDSIFITDVTIDKEMAFADIYVSSIEGEKRSKEILEGFSHAKGFIRRELSQKIELRSFPRLRFRWDPTPQKAEKIELILASLRENNTEK